MDTNALPVKPLRRGRGPDPWQGRADSVGGFGFDAAHHQWLSGFRLAVRTDLGSRLVRTWGVAPAA